MKKLVGLILTFSVSVGSFAMEVEDPVTSQAVFAPMETVKTLELPKPIHLVGMTASAFANYGLTLQRTINRDRRLRINYFNGRPGPQIASKYYESSTVDNSQIDLLSRQRLSVGIDEAFHPFGNPDWDFVLGIGVGYDEAEYELRFYRPWCTWICGYDPNPMSNFRQKDSYVFADARVGARWPEWVIGGLKFDFGVFFDINLRRFPDDQFEVTTPDGTRFAPLQGINGGLFFTEAAYRF